MATERTNLVPKDSSGKSIGGLLCGIVTRPLSQANIFFDAAGKFPDGNFGRPGELLLKTECPENEQTWRAVL
jgi:hypothetical protein